MHDIVFPYHKYTTFNPSHFANLVPEKISLVKASNSELTTWGLVQLLLQIVAIKTNDAMCIIFLSRKESLEKTWDYIFQGLEIKDGNFVDKQNKAIDKMEGNGYKLLVCDASLEIPVERLIELYARFPKPLKHIFIDYSSMEDKVETQQLKALANKHEVHIFVGNALGKDDDIEVSSGRKIEYLEMIGDGLHHSLEIRNTKPPIATEEPEYRYTVTPV